MTLNNDSFGTCCMMLNQATYVLSETGQDNISVFHIACSLKRLSVDGVHEDLYLQQLPVC